MSAILISSDKQEDIRLLTELAERLGVRLFTFPKSEELKKARSSRAWKRRI